MKKARIAIVLLLVAAVALILTGCSFIFGGNDNPAEEEKTYYLKFEGEGVNIEPIALTKGGTLRMPSEPERLGYSFEGWYMDKNYTKTFDRYLAEHNNTISGNITVYAKWVSLGNTVRVFTLNPDAGKVKVAGGAKCEETHDTYEEGEELSIEIVIEDNNYDFLGWYAEDRLLSDEASYTYTVIVKDVVEIEARWQGAQRKAYFYSNYEGASPLYNAVDFRYGDSVTQVPAERDDYGFDGWYDNADCTGLPYTDFSGEFVSLKCAEATVTFYAKWVVWPALGGIKCMSLNATEAQIVGYELDELEGDTVYLPRVWHNKRVAKIKANALADLNKTRIVVPASVTTIEADAFKNSSAALYFDSGADMNVIDSIAGKPVYSHVSNDISGLQAYNKQKITAQYAEAEGMFADTNIDGKEEFQALFAYIWLYTVSGITFDFKSCSAVNSSNMVNTVMGKRDEGGNQLYPNAWVLPVTAKLSLKTNTETGYTYLPDPAKRTITFTLTEKSEGRVATDKTTGADRQIQAISVQATIGGGEAHAFKIDSAPYYDVYNSEQLVYAVEHGFRPYFKAPNSSAETCYRKAREALTSIVKDSYNDYQKLTAIHDYIATNVIYDSELLDLSGVYSAEALSGYRGFNLEGVFIDKRAVCDGITKAFMLMARIEGIEAIRVSGKKANNLNVTPVIYTGHAWNKVKVDNKWYAVDVTGDDPLLGIDNATTIEPLRHDHFLVTDATLELKGYVLDDEDDSEVANSSYNYYANNRYNNKLLTVSDNAVLRGMIEAMKAGAEKGKYYSLEIYWTGTGEPKPNVGGLLVSHTAGEKTYTYIYSK